MSDSLRPCGLQHSRLSQSLPKLKSIESVMPSNHFILCCPLLLLPSIFPSIKVFSNELVLHIRWPKYWSFNFSINPANEYSGLTSFRMDCLDLLAVQRTLKSLLHCHSSNMLMEKSREIAPEGMKRLSQSRKKLWMCQVVEVKSSAVKNKIA